MQAILIVLLIGSFAVWLFDLGAKSLWSDEGLTLRRAEQPLGLIFENVNLIPTGPDYHDGSGPESVATTPDLHPPLYFLLMRFWVCLAGKSEFTLRFPSVAGAILALPLLYAVATALFGRETGLWAALLGASSPFYLWYAQEARMYTWLVVLSLASIYALLPLLQPRPRRRDYACFTIVTLTLLYTHYAGFVLLAFEALVYAVFRVRTSRRAALLMVGVLAVALVPLVPFVWRTLNIEAFSFTYRPLPVILREAWSSFSLGPSSLVIQPWWRSAPFLLLLGVGALMLDVRRRGRALVMALSYLAVPILIQYGLSFVKPNYMNPRHLMVVAPAWELLMAQGLTTLRKRLWPLMAALLALVLFFRGQSSYDILSSHQFWKDDIRGAAQYIQDRSRPGDAIVLHHPVIRLTFDYYYDETLPEVVIPRYGNNDDTERAWAAFEEWAQRYDRLWFLYGPPPTYFPHDFLPTQADTYLFKVRQQEFEAWWTYVGVAAYDDRAPILDELPLAVEPVDHVWDDLRLVGLRTDEGTAGEIVWMDLYWRVAGELPTEPLELRVRLHDEAGMLWYERAEEALPFYTLGEWPSGEIVHTEFRLPLPTDLPPTAYSIAVEPVGFGDPRSVGRIEVHRSTGLQDYGRPPLVSPGVAVFHGLIELLATDLEGETFRAGYPLLGSLTWRIRADLGTDYNLVVRLVDLDGIEITRNETMLSAAGFPTSAWLPGEPVPGRLFLTIPADLGNGRYQVQIGVVEAESRRVAPARRWFVENEWLSIGAVEVEAWPLVTTLPAQVEHRLEQVAIAGGVRLRGYDVAKSEDALRLTLYWQAEEPLKQNYHVFVHVGLPDEPPLAQAGGVPSGWTRPTTTWRAGEVIIDEYAVSLTDVPPGEYALSVGLYDPDTGQRPEMSVDGEIVPGGYAVLEGVDVE
ncbi:MAG: glycosyltransferase family 39 protein [Anaerolineae bacterium]